ncbi:hypothetical protein [Actinoplanes sp. NPDC048796]|uniref:hypothetical protein n=1 Tax=Actinoplanes sp. NPDC048796 TaxID=3155640 RepID=UPI0033EB88A0
MRSHIRIAPVIVLLAAVLGACGTTTAPAAETGEKPSGSRVAGQARREGVDAYSVVGMDQGFFAVDDNQLRGMQHEAVAAATGKTVTELDRQLR